VVALRVGYHQDDVVLGIQQRPQGSVPPGLVAEHDNPHGHPFLDEDE
jgi:hypothetical protein